MRFRPCLRTGVVRGVLVLLLLALMTALAVAQGTSSVRGVVMDPQGSVIPNSKVTLVSLATNAVRTQVTGPSGNFNFELLPPGDYRLEVAAPQFKTAVQSVHALVARPTELEIRLEIGATSETVEVSANNAVQVNTTDSSIGNNIISQQITELPLEAKNVLALLTLQPGVTPDGYVAGARSDQSNVTLDGVNINDAQTNSVGSPVLRLNAEAVEEFRVNTMSANASAGRSAGAQINLVTKGGSNKFKGSLFDYHRNTVFTANNWFSNHATPKVPRQALLRDTLGGTFGGPIKKDKLFFFYSYEGRRDRSGMPVSPRQVPLANLGQGLVNTHVCIPTFDATGKRTSCAAVAGTVYQISPADIATIFPDTGGVNQKAVDALKAGTRYTPNSTAAGDGLNTGGFIFNQPTPLHYNSHVARFDYTVNQNQSVYVRANVIHDHDAQASLSRFPDTPHPQLWSHPWGISASHTWTLSNTKVNSFTYGLTREAFSQTGDERGNDIYFRLVFAPLNGTRAAERTTPTHEFRDDLAWMWGNHAFHFGGNFMMMTNNSTAYSSAWDVAYTNPSGYKTLLIINAANQYLYEKYGWNLSPGDQSSVENAITALLGRFNNYTANFLFDSKGNLLPSGTARIRSFATQGGEGYAQDSWKVTQNLTLTYGLRYSLSRPVYEKNGYEVRPNIPLGEYFNRRVTAMNQGQNYTDLISINKSGPANGGPPLYNWDKKVLLPKVAVAWSPHTENRWLSKLLGGNGQSVLRGGFSVIADYMGPAVASFFDRYNTLGFSSSQVIPVSTFNVGCGHYVVVGNNLASCTPKLGPLFTDFNQSVRAMPTITVPTGLTFPMTKPAKAYPTAIESSLDSQLQTPRNYAWSFTFERELPHNAVVQFSYLGRQARHLLAQRDIATPINLKDPKSGMTWYQAGTILEKARQAGTPLSYFASHPIPYFENLFPLANVNANFCPTTNPNCYANSTSAVYDDALNNANDWTTTALDLEPLSVLGAHAFYQPQYGALDTWTTIANSNYHAFTASFRQRLRDVTLDFNYTWSHSLDDASGLQANGSWSNSALILNPFQQRDNYKSSDFDMRHMINVNLVWSLPFGKGKAVLNGAHGVVQGFVGGWQLSTIFRWNTGQPFGAPYDAGTWATNWQVQSYTTVGKPLAANGCPTRLVTRPQFFGNCETAAYQSFRSSYPGDTGDRNYFRWPGNYPLDLGLGKTFTMPYAESQTLQVRVETFNVFNHQPFGAIDWSRNGWGIQPVPGSLPAPNFSQFTAIQGDRRVMQIGAVYRF